MDLVVRPHIDELYICGDAHAAQRTGKRLFGFVRMHQHAGAQHVTVWGEHVKRIGIVVPSRIRIPDGDVETVRAISRPLDVDIKHIGVTRESRARESPGAKQHHRNQ